MAVCWVKVGGHFVLPIAYNRQTDHHQPSLSLLTAIVSAYSQSPPLCTLTPGHQPTKVVPHFVS